MGMLGIEPGQLGLEASKLTILLSCPPPILLTTSQSSRWGGKKGVLISQFYAKKKEKNIWVDVSEAQEKGSQEGAPRLSQFFLVLSGFNPFMSFLIYLSPSFFVFF